MAVTNLFVPWMDKYIQKIQQNVADSRTSGIYGADFGHIGVKFFGPQRHMGFERKFYFLTEL